MSKRKKSAPERTASIPPESLEGCGAIRITTYKEYEEKWEKLLSTRFTDDKQTAFVIVGRPGICKSFFAKRHFDAEMKREKETEKRKKRYHSAFYLFGGNIRPIRAYIGAYKNRGRQLCFDDAENLWGSQQGRDLMIQMLEGDFSKRLEWNSSHYSIGKVVADKVEAKPSFTTTSPIILIGNKVFIGKFKDEAIKSRVCTWWFDPCKREIHNYVGRWFRDSEIYNYIADHLHNMVQVDCRLYNKCLKLKRMKQAWKGLVKQYISDPRLKIIREIEDEDEAEKKKQRKEDAQKAAADRRREKDLGLGADVKAKRFKDAMLDAGMVSGISLSAYYRLRAEYKSKGLLDKQSFRRYRHMKPKSNRAKQFDVQGHLEEIYTAEKTESPEEEALRELQEEFDAYKEKAEKTEKALRKVLNAKAAEIVALKEKKSGSKKKR